MKNGTDFGKRARVDTGKERDTVTGNDIRCQNMVFIAKIIKFHVQC